MLLASGCSNKINVSGTVTYSDDGSPAKAGTVIFTSGNISGRSEVVDGKYSIGLEKDGDGIPPGTYTVIAEKFIPSITTEDNKDDVETYRTKEPLTVDVKATMTFDIVVERLKAGARPIMKE